MKESKLTFVNNLFDRVAPRYDLINLLITLGQLSRWRKTAISKVELKPGMKLLDLGCGSGWTIRYLNKKYPKLIIEGIDPSDEMLKIAKSRTNATYSKGIAENITKQDNTYDIIYIFFTIRNFSNEKLAISEMLRVLKPNGKLVLLDSFPAKNKTARTLQKLWLKKIIPCITFLLTDRKAYNYLANSIISHPGSNSILEIINSLKRRA